MSAPSFYCVRLKSGQYAMISFTTFRLLAQYPILNMLVSVYLDSEDMVAFSASTGHLNTLASPHSLLSENTQWLLVPNFGPYPFVYQFS